MDNIDPSWMLIYCAVTMATVCLLKRLIVQDPDPLSRIPGPTPLPILGNLPQLITKSAINKTYLDWAKKYGPIFK